MSGIAYHGIDVGIQRGCANAALDDQARMVANGWFDTAVPPALLESIQAAPNPVHVGIDAPRQPVPHPREWYWNGAANQWRRRKGEEGAGRHCEVVIKAHGLGNPQWTPLATSQIPPWMELGFQLFEAFAEMDNTVVHEVFPTASYHQFETGPTPFLTLSLNGFRPGPKDMLDASVAAITVREFDRGHGVELGGGDGLGTIVVPRPLTKPKALVLEWPTTE